MIGFINNSSTLHCDALVPLNTYKTSSGVYYLEQNFNYLNEHLKKHENENVTTVAFFADLHTSVLNSVRFNPYKTSQQWANNQNSINRLDRAFVVLSKLSKSHKIDAVVLGGDYLANNVNTSKDGAIGTKTSSFGYGGFKGINLCLKNVQNQMPILICKGNHDTNSMNSYDNTASLKEYSDSIYGEESEENGVRYLEKPFNVVYGNEFRDYGYMDDEDNKLRIIFLNTSDIDLSQTKLYTSNPTTKLANLSHNYNPQYKWFMGQKQLDFLVNNALNFPKDKSGWNVVVFSHYQFLKDGATISSTYVEMINELFIRFRRKEKFSMNYSYSTDAQYKQFNVSLNADFSQINAGGADVKCFIHGHYHSSKIDKRYYKIDANGKVQYSSSNGWTGYLPTMCVSAFGSTGGSAWDGRRYEHTPYNKIGVREADFEILQFKKDGSNFYIYGNRYGAGLSATYKITSLGDISVVNKDLHILLSDENGHPIGGLGDKVTVEFNGGTIGFNVVSALPTASDDCREQEYLQISGDKYIFSRCFKYTEDGKTKYGWYGKTVNTSKISWAKGHLYFYNLPSNEVFDIVFSGDDTYEAQTVKVKDVNALANPYTIKLKKKQ